MQMFNVHIEECNFDMFDKSIVHVKQNKHKNAKYKNRRLLFRLIFNETIEFRNEEIFFSLS